MRRCATWCYRASSCSEWSRRERSTEQERELVRVAVALALHGCLELPPVLAHVVELLLEVVLRDLGDVRLPDSVFVAVHGPTSVSAEVHSPCLASYSQRERRRR